VTEASGRLREAGAVTCRRGVFAVQDRKLLEARSCSCYHAAHREYTRLFPVHAVEVAPAATPARPILAPVPATGWGQLAAAA
jgi:hypothetical protein